MRAAEKTYNYTINWEVSELDESDSVRVLPAYRHVNLKSTLTSVRPMDVMGLADGTLNVFGMVDFSKASVATQDDVSGIEVTFLSGNEYLGKWVPGDNSVMFESLLTSSRTNITGVISFTVDTHGVDGQTTPDGTDDREQKGYNVRLETNIGSDLYSIEPTYYVNANDDLVKKVSDGDYVNLPGLYASKWDGDQEYVYQYRIDGDTIYGDWVKEGSALFAKSTTNDKDTNGDGKVSCDEYYGTTGLEWSDKLNACVVSSTGDAVVTIPNTATK